LFYSPCQKCLWRNSQILVNVYGIRLWFLWISLFELRHCPYSNIKIWHVNTRETCYVFWQNLMNCNKLELRNALLWISVQLWYVHPLLQGNENWPKTICLLITSSILRPINKLEAYSRLIYFCGLCYFGKRKTSLYSLYSKHILS